MIFFSSDQDDDGNFHAILHNLEGPHMVRGFREARVGIHAFSQDGERWFDGGTPHDYRRRLGCILPRVPAIIVRTGLAYTNLVNFTDRTSWNFNRRERPHLIFAEGSRTIIALTNSAEPGGRSGDRTFTLVQGVKRDGVE